MQEDMALRGLTSDTQRDDIWFAARFATCLGARRTRTVGTDVIWPPGIQAA
jgi:hypothetical protein